MYKVAVLMSTYNGAGYLREQVDSILEQEGVSMRLFVRDDGSADATLDILEYYAQRQQLEWSKGGNLGPALSFMELLKTAPDADFYAFADQDDVWHPRKLLIACQSLSASQGPALYAGQTQLVDAKLNELPTPQLEPRLTFGESQIYAFASGCTMVMNHQLRQFIITHLPATMPMLHDFWTYTVAQGIGADIVFDKTAYIKYRQHANNAVGLEQHSCIEEWRKRIRRIFLERGAERSRNTRILLDTIGREMIEQSRLLAQRLVEAKHSPTERLHLLLDRRYRCGDAKTWWLFKLAVLINAY